MIAGDSNTLSYYLHRSEGDIKIASGTSLEQSIYSLVPPDYLLIHAENQFQKISQVANLNFVELSDPNLADISFYWDREIELDDSYGITFGLSLINYTQQPKREWFEIFFNGPQLNQYGSDFNSYVFNHELLHALGFEHTFDSSDGDFYLSTDPLQSATPEETTMSYRPPASGIYPTDLAPADYQALIDIWGPRTASSQEIYRLYNSILGIHLFTSNLEEIDILTGSSTHSESSSTQFINEGIAYIVGPDADQDLYRFYDTKTSRHFYSANIDEKNLLISSDQYSSFIYEGVAFKVFSANQDLIDNSKTPVFRFYDLVANTHLYTANVEELKIWNGSLDFINEGIAWYA